MRSFCSLSIGAKLSITITKTVVLRQKKKKMCSFIFSTIFQFVLAQLIFLLGNSYHHFLTIRLASLCAAFKTVAADLPFL